MSNKRGATIFGFKARLLAAYYSRNSLALTDAYLFKMALEKIKQAVDLGELDEQIELASGALRAGFSK